MWPSPHNGYSYSSDDDSSQQASYLGNSIFLLVLILILFNPPPGLVLLFFIMIILMSCMRAIQLHRAIGRAEDAMNRLPVTVQDASGASSQSQAHAGMLRLLRSGQIMLLPQAGAAGRNGQPRQPIEPAELELLLLSELAQAATLRQQAVAAAAASALTDQDLATLPCAPYKKPAASTAPTSPAAATTAAPGAAASEQAGAQGKEGSEQQGSVEGQASECGGSKSGDNGLMCSICLDPVEDGAMVLTLPCLHQYHADCVQPWLRQQGRGAECPMCKTKVFARR